MGFLDNLKDKAGEFGDKAREGFEAAKDKASDLTGDVRDRFDGDPDTTAAEAPAPATTDPLDPAVDPSTAGPIESVVPGVESIDPAEADEDPLGPASVRSV